MGENVEMAASEDPPLIKVPHYVSEVESLEHGTSCAIRAYGIADLGRVKVQATDVERHGQ